ncbi:hypothetical protein TCAL_16346, partial [Tigriopus californicus]
MKMNKLFIMYIDMFGLAMVMCAKLHSLSESSFSPSRPSPLFGDNVPYRYHPRLQKQERYHLNPIRKSRRSDEKLTKTHLKRYGINLISSIFRWPQKSRGANKHYLHNQLRPIRYPDDRARRAERSVDTKDQSVHEGSKTEEPLAKHEQDKLQQAAGLNHIPGFSSSEEKLLEYTYDSSSDLDNILVQDPSDYSDEAKEGTEDDDNGRSRSGSKNRRHRPRLDIVTKLLRIVESQALQGANCTPGTDLNLGDKVVNRYAQERFHQAARVAVNRANWLTRMWKYAPEVIGQSEYLLHTSIMSMVEFNEDIFAAGNCYDAEEYKSYFLFCPYAYRLPEGPILAKDLAIEYKYLSNTSEWFFIARKEAEKVIEMGKSLKIGYHTYPFNATAHTSRETDMILRVAYEDGAWSKPYYDCGGGNIWMMTYTVPFFGFENGKYFFKGTSGIDIDLRRVDINQCKGPIGAGTLNIFGGTDKCKTESTMCQPISGLGFRRGSYKCVCKIGYYFSDASSHNKFFNGTTLEEEYAKILEGEKSIYEDDTAFQCLKCAPGCEECVDPSPCIVSLNWVLRSILLILQCIIIGCLPIVVLFTYKYKNIKVVRAASPLLLRIIILGAFFIYSTTIVLYPVPNIVTCTMRIWLREIGFALSYGALMLKTWRISVIFRVRSAKAIKITDMDLIKRLGIIVGIFVLCLLIRTLVSPPVVIVGRTAENLKAFLCQSDWWDHSFTILEFLFLLWGIRLCIMVRKAPSEFNESRFISMTIYNEFLLSIFLNVSMFFLQHPANPDLLYIIFFCHSQLTITILLCLIFASKFYLVVKGHGKPDEGTLSKNGPGKFLASKVRAAHASLSQQSNPTIGQVSSLCNDGILSEKDIQLELDKIFQTLSILKDKNSHGASHAVTSRITSIQEAFKDTERSSGINGDGLRQSSLPQGDIRNRDEPLATRHIEKRSGNTTFGGFGGALVVAETAALAAATLSSQGARVPKATIEEEPENCSQTEVESSRNCSGVSKLPLQICLDEAKVDPKTLVVEKELKIDKLTLESQKIMDSVSLLQPNLFP